MKEKTKGKRLLSILLACIMMISLVPTVAFAAEPVAGVSISALMPDCDERTVNDFLDYVKVTHNLGEAFTVSGEMAVVNPEKVGTAEMFLEDTDGLSADKGYLLSLCSSFCSQNGLILLNLVCGEW